MLVYGHCMGLKGDGRSACEFKLKTYRKRLELVSSLFVLHRNLGKLTKIQRQIE